MKTGLIFLFAVTGLISTDEKVTVDIVAVDFNIETFASVRCSDFMETFEKREIKKQKIRSEKQVNKILDQLKNLQPTDSKRKTDTRAKLFVKYENGTDTICADRFLLIYKGTSYSMTEELRQIIWRKN